MSNKSYDQILKSSSIMGGAAGITMLLGMVRTKFAAVLIGTAGVGLLANFGAIQGLVGTLAGLGLGSSAVRDVAAAVATGDQTAIGRTVLTLRRMCWLTGTVGMLAMMAFSPLLAQWTFGNQDHTLEIAALGLVIFFGNLSSGQIALINGMRRIGDLARLGVISALVGTAVSIGFYLWLGLPGIVPALVLASAINLLITWHYAKRVPVSAARLSWTASFSMARGMIKLGVVMMSLQFLGAITAYATLKFIASIINLEAVGIYSAAFALSGLFVNFMLTAMGADYYPRLTGLAADKVAMNRLINQQTEIGALIAVPGLLATLSLAPWMIQLFYTAEFLQASVLIQWFALGCLGRVVSWPLTYTMLSLNKKTWFFVVEIAFQLIHLGLIVILLNWIGLVGVSIAFFIQYALYTAVVYCAAKMLTGFSWAHECRILLANLTIIILALFIAIQFSPVWLSSLIGIAVFLATSCYCIRKLIMILGKKNRIAILISKVPGFGSINSAKNS